MRLLLMLSLGATALIGVGCDGKTGDDTAPTDDTDSDTTDRPSDTVDADGDGYTADEDCDDDDLLINPGAVEVCDGVDNDCDGTVDVDAVDGTTYYADADGDGAGLEGSTIIACGPTDGYSDSSGDCDDTDPALNTADVDGDGFSTCLDDCDDTPAGGDINPAADEACDEVDNDCDDLIDEDGVAYYADDDGDGYGVDADSVFSCEPVKGYVAQGGDCDDDDALAYPGAAELCDGVQSDCDGTTWAGDDGTATFIADADGSATDLTAELTGAAGSPASAILSDDGVLNICAGDWYVNLELDANVAVVGFNGAEATTLHGEEGGPVITLQSGGLTASVEGLTLTNGSGGYSSSSTSFDRIGGGLLCDGQSELTVNDTIITGNSSFYGGGVAALRSCYLTLQSVEITNNETTENVGGGMYVHEAAAAIYDSVIAENVATNNNGGLTGVRSELIIERTEIRGNITPYSGGGLYLFDYCYAEITDTVFEDNQSESEGGGAYIYRSDVVLTNVSFLNNESLDDNGGGLATTSTSTVTCDVCEFDGNVSSDRGGGVYLNDDSTGTFTDTTFGVNSPDDIEHGESYTYGGTVSVTCSGEVCL